MMTESIASPFKACLLGTTGLCRSTPLWPPIRVRLVMGNGWLWFDHARDVDFDILQKAHA